MREGSCRNGGCEVTIGVDWDSLGQPAFDRIVEALLERLHNAAPGVDVRVYDGRGGDGGRDIVARSGAHVALFQLKYFRDGFSSEHRKRRRQITKSFQTAVRDHKPTAWFLVIPTNPTPGEETFVNELAAGVPGLKVKIRGRSYLDERLAAHPDLVDYFGRDQLFEAAKVYQQEKAILHGGLADLTDRHRGIGRIAASLDPDWFVESGLRDGVVEHVLLPKHTRAALKSPITMTVTASFGPEHAALAAAVRRSLGFGTSDPVTLPPEVVRDLTFTGPSWLTLPDGPIEVTWTPAADPSHAPSAAEIELVDAEGLVAASYQGTVRHSGAGVDGYAVEIDFNGAASLTLMAGRDGQAEVDGKFAFTDLPPAVVRETVSLFRDLHTSHGLSLRLDGTSVGRFSRASFGPLDERTEQDLAVTQMLADDLDVVQRHCRTFFPVPVELSVDDRIAIRFARLLIEGHCVVSPNARSLTVTLNGSHSDEFDRMLSSEAVHAFRIDTNLVLAAAGRRLTLGQAAFFHTQVEIHNRVEALAALRRGRGAGHTLKLQPINGQSYRAFLPNKRVGRENEPLLVTGWGLGGLDGPSGG